jgi:hypothetical protein
VDSGILTFINHGCNGTFNMGQQSDYHESNIEGDFIPDVYRYYAGAGLPYTPMADRNVYQGESIAITSEDVKAGEELRDNYMTYGGEQGFSKFKEELRKQCAGEFGEIEEYQRMETLNDTNRVWSF